MWNQIERLARAQGQLAAVARRTRAELCAFEWPSQSWASVASEPLLLEGGRLHGVGPPISGPRVTNAASRAVGIGLARYLELADRLAGPIDHTHAGLFHRYIQSDIMFHGCASPLMFEAAHADLVFTISLKRSHLIRHPAKPASPNTPSSESNPGGPTRQGPDQDRSLRNRPESIAAAIDRGVSLRNARGRAVLGIYTTPWNEIGPLGDEFKADSSVVWPHA